MVEPDEANEAQRQPMAFISHHSSQVEQARHIARVLDRHGIKGWMAPDDIEPGQAFDQVIIEQIGKCDVILLLFSAESDQSKHVKREVMLAEQQGKLIYPIRLESIQPEGLAYWLQDYQWIDWLDGRDDAIERMVTTIRRQLALPQGTAPAPGPVPAPPPPPPAPPAEPVAPVAALQPAAQPATARSNAPLVFGVIGGVLFGAVLLGLALDSGGGDLAADSAITSSPGGDEEAHSTLFSSGGDTANSSAQPFGPIALRAGSWQVSYQLGDFSSDFPGADRQQAAALVSAYSGTACVSEAEARDPGRTVLAAFITGQPNCQVDSGAATGGSIDSRAVCDNGQDGTHSEVDAQGSYTADAANAAYDVVQWFQALGSGQSTEMTVTMTARRVGDC